VITAICVLAYFVMSKAFLSYARRKPPGNNLRLAMFNIRALLSALVFSFGGFNAVGAYCHTGWSDLCTLVKKEGRR
jgi:hypothetical protein